MYQLWHSVFAWVNLGDEGYLHLEGAEDIDEHGIRRARTTQIKREDDNLTLNTDRAREVIENFWKLRLGNPDHDVEFHLVSTSGIGKEQDETFGERRGIEVWNKSAKTAEDRRQIKAFLEKQEFSAPLKEFIKTASAKEIDEKIVERLRWDMNQPQTSGVVAAVERKLVLLGKEYGVGPQDAKDAAPHLFALIARKAAEKTIANRRLDKAELLELFYDKTHQRVTNSFFRQQEQLLQAVVSGMGNSSLQIAPSTLLVTGQIPNSPVQLISREPLVAQVAGLVQSHEIVVLQGSTGMGKTRLAAIAAAGHSLVWVDLSAAPDQGPIGAEVKSILDEVARRIDAAPETELVVLDDLDLPPSVLSVCRSSLEALLYTLQQNGTRLLITSQKELPPEFAALAGAASVETLSVPLFDDEEIDAILRQHGCPEDQVPAWRVHLGMVAGGHPQLVHARVVNLAAAGWPRATLDTIFEVPHEVNQMRRNAALLLNETRPQDLGLIYPLSLLTGRFRRELAVRVGETIGTLPNAGDNFERLVGPWIELVGEGYYRLSPLLSSAATGSWTPEKVRTTRVAVGQAILDGDELSLIEAANVLFQAVAAQSQVLFGQLIPGILSVPEEGRKAFAHYCSWYVSVHVEQFESLEIGMRKMALSLQLIVAVEARPESVMPVLEKIRTICDGSDEIDRMLLTVSEMQVYFAGKEINIRDAARLLVNHHASKVIAWTDPEVARLIQNAQTGVEDDGISFDEMLFAMLLQRVRDPISLRELIAELRENAPLRQIFEVGLATATTQANLMINGAWLGEEAKAAPAWDGVLVALREAANFGIEFKIQPIYEAAIRAVVVIQDEYLNDYGAAEATIAAALTQFAEPGPIILDGQATYFLNRSRWEDAFAIWERILPNLEYDPLTGDTISVWGRRKAAIAAGELGRWDRCAELFAEAIAQLEGFDQDALRIGLRVDRANALWRGGRRPEAVSAYSEALIELSELAVSHDNLPLFKLQRCFGQSLINISRYKDMGLEGMNRPIPIGFCSDPNVPEQFRELAVTATESMWTLLLSTELGTEIPAQVKEAARTRLSVSFYPYNRMRYWEFVLEENLLHFTGNQAGLLDACQQYVVASTLVAAELTAGRPIPNLRVTAQQLVPSGANMPPATLVAVFDVMLAALMMSELDVPGVLASWRAEALPLPLFPVFNAWLADVQQVLALPEYDSVQLVVSGKGGTQSQRYVAGLRVCRDSSNQDLVELFCTHLLVCERLFGCPLFSLAGAVLLPSVVQAWEGQFGSRSQFLMPSVSIPGIREAIQSELTGLRKIAAIVLAARTAVYVDIPKAFEDHLKHLARQ